MEIFLKLIISFSCIISVVANVIFLIKIFKKDRELSIAILKDYPHHFKDILESLFDLDDEVIAISSRQDYISDKLKEFMEEKSRTIAKENNWENMKKVFKVPTKME